VRQVQVGVRVATGRPRRRQQGLPSSLGLEIHDADTDIFADILAMIVARMSACRSACRRNDFRKSRVGEDPREDVRVGAGAGVGVVEFPLHCVHPIHSTLTGRILE